MARAPAVDGMFVGEPEDGVLQLAALESLERLGDVPSLTWRAATAQIVPHRAHGSFTGFLDDAVPGVGSAGARALLAAARQQALRHRRNEPRLPVHRATSASRRSTRATSSASAAPKALVDEIERGYRELGVEFFYLWGDTVTLNVKSFTRVLRRADRAASCRSSGSATRAPTTSPTRRSCTG